MEGRVVTGLAGHLHSYIKFYPVHVLYACRHMALCMMRCSFATHPPSGFVPPVA
jgi:hypothetical protein